MARGKKHTPEQVVNLLRQIEVAVANGKAKGSQNAAGDRLDSSWEAYGVCSAAGRGCEAVEPSVIHKAHLMASKYMVRMSGSCHDSGVWPRVE